MFSTTVTCQPVGCSVIAQSVYRATANEIPALRKSPGSFGGQPIAASLLRHADEQTVVGLVAILEAAGQHEAAAGDFADWGVLAAPRFLGRSMFEVAFPQFVEEGAWGVSPHLVPSQSLHSASGTISQAIKAHGPNLGIGGSIGSGPEGLIAAATWLQAGMVAGVWLVLSHRIGELENESGIHPRGDYQAMALALVLDDVPIPSTRLQVFPDRLQIDPTRGTLADRNQLAEWLGLSPIPPRNRPGRSIRVDPAHLDDSSRFPHVRPDSDKWEPAEELRETS